MFYGSPRALVRPVALGIAELDGYTPREVTVVIGPRGTDFLLGILFLRTFKLKLVADPTNNLVELVDALGPGTAGTRSPKTRRRP
jgi:hypothetical protein